MGRLLVNSFIALLMQPLLLQLSLAAALTAEQSAAAAGAAASGYGYGRKEAEALAVDGEGAMGPAPELLRGGRDGAGAGRASASVAPNGAAAFWHDERGRARSLGQMTDPISEGLELAALAAKVEGKRRGPGAKDRERRRAPAAERAVPAEEERPGAAAPAWGEQLEAALDEEQRPEEVEQPEELQEDPSPEEALIELPEDAEGQDRAPSAATPYSSASASIRREPPRGPRGALAPEAPVASGQVSLARENQEEQQAPSATADGDLKAELDKDAANLMSLVSWKVNWKVALSFLSSMVLGLVLGVIIGLLSGALKAEDNSGVPLGGALVILSVCCLAAVITPAVMLVHDLLYNLELIGGQMVNTAVGTMGVDMLIRIEALEKAAHEQTKLDWTINLMNPSNDPITLTRIICVVGMNNTATLLWKLKPLPVTLQPGATEPVPLTVDPRQGHKIRQTFEMLTRGGKEWVGTFRSETFDLSVEGTFRGKDFTMGGIARLPMRLADLPMPATWPAGLDLATVQRSITAGLQDLHSESGSLVTLPGASKSILEYDSLTVEGPLRTWFMWSMILCTSFALPFSCCLSLGGLKIAGGAGKPGKAGEESATTPLAGAAADPAAAAAAPGAPAAGAETTPPATPAPAAAPAPAQAESPAPATRTARSVRAAQAKPAPAPAAAPAAGGDDDEHEF